MPDIFYIQKIDHNLLKSEVNATLQRLKALLPNTKIIEIGSTAVDGAIGKNDIDILISPPKERFQKTRDLLDLNFKKDLQQISNSSYQAYIVPSKFDTTIQLTFEGSEYDHFEIFLNSLKNNPEQLEKYNQLKERWHGRPMEGYRKEKQIFIKNALQSALK